MRYRVDELADRAGCSVDTIRFYQKRDLLPPPEREGRVAWYDDEHLERLSRIRALAASGLTLEQIHTLHQGSDPIVDVLTRLAGTGQATLDRDDLAERSGLTRDVVDLVVDTGLVTGVETDPEAFTPDVVEMLRAGRAVLAAGVDPEALAHLALRHSDHVDALVTDAVDLFRRSMGTDRMATADEVAELIPAVVTLVAHHFNASLLRAAIGTATSGGGDDGDRKEAS